MTQKLALALATVMLLAAPAAGHAALVGIGFGGSVYSINETMRLMPVAPLMVLQALRDTAVGDVAVPKETLVMGVLRHDSMSERNFQNPLAFEPQRWLPDSPQPMDAVAKRAAMPFGSGPRMCPGRYLALLEMKLAMAMLLASFDIQAVDTPDGNEAQERMAVTMNPVGLSMRLRERR